MFGFLIQTLIFLPLVLGNGGQVEVKGPTLPAWPPTLPLCVEASESNTVGMDAQGKPTLCNWQPAALDVFDAPALGPNAILYSFGLSPKRDGTAQIVVIQQPMIIVEVYHESAQTVLTACVLPEFGCGEVEDAGHAWSE